MFYAFPYTPLSVGETINNALAILRNDQYIKQQGIRFYPWTDMSPGGKPLVSSILREIDKASVFACDLTFPNSNVSFELGYAIARFKRIWISLDAGAEGAEQHYRRIYFGLTGAAYTQYVNSTDLAAAFLRDMPTSSLDDTLLGAYYRNPSPRPEASTLMYVRPPTPTEAVISCIEAFDETSFGNFIHDDPNENQSPTLDWYASNLTVADAVLVHLLAEDQLGHLEHNVKCALVAGLAQGFRKEILMVSKMPFRSAIDYQHLLQTHNTAAECKQIMLGWADRAIKSIPRRRTRRPNEQAQIPRQLDLRSLAIGEPVAENERQRLDDYFLETSTYFRALDDPITIVVGRRGTGKSAQLYAMETYLRTDRRNNVCIIKPVGYELDGLVRVLRSIEHNSERGYLIESLWKFLIYSELARSVYRSIQSRPPQQPPTNDEERLVKHYDMHQDVLDPPFSERLDKAIASLVDIGGIDDAIGQRRRISELLHTSQLRHLRQLLGDILTNSRRVHILIDNLDAQWGPGADVDTLAPLLWGLLQVSEDIVSDFGIADHRRKPVTLYLTVFLRSDIFAAIQPQAFEQDKLPIQRITWNDAETLRRLVDLRIQFGLPSGDTAQNVWARLFPEEVVGRSVRGFIDDTALQRPRDVVFLMRQAIDVAINRGHLSVTEEDLLDARDKYSEYAFRSILAEDDPRKGKLESILYEFAGCPKIILRSQVEENFATAKVAPSDFDFYLDLLCDVNFLAIESRDGYEYATDEADRAVKRQIAGTIARGNQSEETYQVSSAFWQVLRVE